MKWSRAHALFLVFSFAGILISLWSAQHWYDLQLGTMQGKSFCNVTDYWNCDRVSLSSWSAFANIPLGIFSAAYFFVMMVLSFTQGMTGRKLFFLHLPAWVVSAFLAYHLIGVLQTGCLICFAMDAAWLGAGLSALFIGRTGPFPLRASLLILLVGLGLFSIYPLKRSGELNKLPPAAEIERFKAWFQTQPVENIPARGPFLRPAATDAKKIQVIDFSDFQCPHCRTAALGLVPFLLAQPDIEFVFYPLPFDSSCHPDLKGRPARQSCDWSKVAICAAEQNAFWDVHEEIYAIAQSGNPSVNSENLRKLQLDQADLEECLKSEETKNTLAELIQVSRDAKVGATPTFLINGRRLPGLMPNQLIKILLDDMRARAQ